MKRLIYIYFFLLSFLLLFPSIRLQKSLDLKNLEIFMPKIIIVYNNIIYILDKSNYNISIIKDGQVVKKFGRKGEGPGEFR